MNSSLVIKRSLDIFLPDGKSTFLWGARQVGKSTLLKNNFADSIYYDFLKSDLYFEFIKKPNILREHLNSQYQSKKLSLPIILDEVQKIPNILDEVQWLIENKGLSFILCGSSARKMRKGQSNLLGGRAWRYELYPLTYFELKEKFNLLQALNRGLLPSHYFDKYYKKSIKYYVQDYLKEEIMAEGLSRNIPAFSRFLDSLAFSQGELVSFANIARDCGIDAKTVKEYYQILVDTLLGYFIEPFTVKRTRQILTKTSKFYLFDVGLANYLQKNIILEARGEQFGRAFEHFILMEIVSYRAYKDLDFPILFWRTKNGIEVDFVLGSGEIYIEIKGKQEITNKDLKGLLIFQSEYNPKKSILVYNGKMPLKKDGVDILPYNIFLQSLWSGDII